MSIILDKLPNNRLNLDEFKSHTDAVGFESMWYLGTVELYIIC